MTLDKIPLKTKEEIEKMRIAGHILGSTLQKLKAMSVVGVDHWEVEQAFIEFCEHNNVRPACKNYQPQGYPPFPTGLCLSIDEQSVHCIPEKGRLFKNGDLVTIDTVIEYEGLYVDSAVTFGIGQLPQNKQKMLEVTKLALDETIKLVKPGIRVGDLSNKMQKIAQSNGFSVLTTYAGHGIGKSMHEPPEIPCFGKKGKGPIIQENMTLAIEPLICERKNDLKHINFWQTKTIDNGLFAQFEHTVLVTKNGFEILTLPIIMQNN